MKKNEIAENTMRTILYSNWVGLLITMIYSKLKNGYVGCSKHTLIIITSEYVLFQEVDGVAVIGDVLASEIIPISICNNKSEVPS